MLPVCRQRLSCRTALSVGRSASSVRPGAGASSIRDQPATRSLRTISPARTVPWSKAPTPTYTTTRSFGLPSLSSFLPSSPSGGNESPKRVLTATRTLPYSPALLFKVISSVESYSQFLPFLNESTVTARDPETGYPTQAYLTVGYGPLSETFTSLVTCDPVNWIVEAKSGAKFGEAKGAGRSGASSSSGLSSFFPGATEGIFEYLDTQWRLSPLAPVDAPGGPQTKVTLEVRFEFRNQMHAKIMGAVEGHMASVMIEAFEKRIRETHTQGQ